MCEVPLAVVGAMGRFSPTRTTYRELLAHYRPLTCEWSPGILPLPRSGIMLTSTPPIPEVPTHQHRRVARVGLTRHVADRPRALGHLARLCIRSAAAAGHQVAEIATPAAEGRAPGGQRAGHPGLPAGRPQRGPGSRAADARLDLLRPRGGVTSARRDHVDPGGPVSCRTTTSQAVRGRASRLTTGLPRQLPLKCRSPRIIYR